MYAQTNIQLYNQLRKLEYSVDDLALIRNAYELAVQLFTSRYRRTGKTFLAHVVGTASIVAFLQQKPALTAAALLHAAYTHGDFGLAKKSITSLKRKQLIRKVGSKVETYVAKYSELRWNAHAARNIQKQLDTLTGLERDVLLMRLANELEDHLDCSAVYRYDAEKYREKLDEKRKLLASLSQALSVPLLTEEINRVFAECMDSSVVTELLPQDSRRHNFFIPPRSYWKSPWIRIRHKMGRVLHLVSRSNQ